jgi:hypothetical protein
MDAVSSAGVAPQSAFLSHSSFADAAIARALHSSLSDHAPEPPATAAAAAMLMHGAVAGTDCPPAAAPSPSQSSSARCRVGPAAGRAGKRRRPRPSQRAPTTYISADAATFRAMVQRVTGADEDDLQPQQQDRDSLGLLLPHLGVEQFLQAAGPASHVAVATAPYATASPATAAYQHQQPLFPTLDSWNVMYGKKDEVVSVLTAGQ